MGELDHINGGKCCQHGLFGDGHACAKQDGAKCSHARANVEYPCGACQTGIDAGNASGCANLAPDSPQLTAAKGFNGRLLDARRNGAGIERSKLRESTGRPKGARNLHAKHPSSIARAFKKAGLDWQADFADAIKRNRRDRIALWLRLLPYMVTTANKSIKVKKWKGKASKAALIALDALEQGK